MPPKRQAAYVLSIHDVLRFTEQSSSQDVLPRINIMGIIVSLDIDGQLASLVVDDSTASIIVRFFESNELLEKLAIGDIVTLIGFPRRLHAEIYLVPEIIKKIERQKWIEYRNLELKILKPLYELQITNCAAFLPQQKDVVEKQVVTEEIVGDMIKDVEEKTSERAENEEEQPQHESVLDCVIRAITELDGGKGAVYEEVVARVQHSDCERMIRKLIEQGEIFEVKPGRLKVL